MKKITILYTDLTRPKSVRVVPVQSFSAVIKNDNIYMVRLFSARTTYEKVRENINNFWFTIALGLERDRFFSIKTVDNKKRYLKKVPLIRFSRSTQ